MSATQTRIVSHTAPPQALEDSGMKAAACSPLATPLDEIRPPLRLMQVAALAAEEFATVQDVLDTAQMDCLPLHESIAKVGAIGPIGGLEIAWSLSCWLAEHGVAACRVCGCTQEDMDSHNQSIEETRPCQDAQKSPSLASNVDISSSPGQRGNGRLQGSARRAAPPTGTLDPTTTAGRATSSPRWEGGDGRGGSIPSNDGVSDVAAPAPSAITGTRIPPTTSPPISASSAGDATCSQTADSKRSPLIPGRNTQSRQSHASIAETSSGRCGVDGVVPATPIGELTAWSVPNRRGANGGKCRWVEADLCSACVGVAERITRDELIREARERHPGRLLCFREGETGYTFMDATQHDHLDALSVPHTFLAVELEKHLRKLLKAGHMVAVVDQAQPGQKPGEHDGAYLPAITRRNGKVQAEPEPPPVQAVTPAAPAPPADGVWQMIPTESIKPSPWNPRKRFDQDALAELAVSLSQVGMLEPLLVRALREPGPILDDYAVLEDIAGTHTDHRSMECANNLMTRWGISTYGQLKSSALADTTTTPTTVKPVKDGGISTRQAAALSQAILACRRPGGPQSWELVAGERRLRAAKLAELASVPCIVRDLSDAQARAALVIENEQRADTLPLEKAAGYEQMIRLDGISIEQIAEKTGKSVSTVRETLRLLKAPVKVREALERGDITPSVAGLVARVPPGKGQGELVEWLLAGENRYDRQGAQPWTFRAVKANIERYHQVELKGAPFNRKSLDLVPEAGSCDACPKRVGNLAASDPEAYEGVRADVCTDPGCYDRKLSAYQQSAVAKAKEGGQTILTTKQAEKAFPYGSHIARDSGYFDLADQCQEDKKKTKRSYKQLLDGHLPEADVVLAFDRKGNLHRLVKQDLALPILKKEHGLYKRAVASDNGAGSEKEEQAKRREENAIAKAKERSLLGAIADKAEPLVQMLPDNNPCLNQVLRACCLEAFDKVWSQVREGVVGRRGHKTSRSSDVSEGFKNAIMIAAGKQLFALLVELLGGQMTMGEYYRPDHAETLLSALGIDRKAVQSEAEKAYKASKKKGGKSDD